MKKFESVKCITVGLVLAIFSILWSANGYALERRVGSMEFTYTCPDPVGMVILNHTDELKPSISYQIPASPGGSFTTPWAMLIGTTGIIADTLLILTNPGDSEAINITVTLRNKDGIIEDMTKCIRTITLEPKATVLRSSRTLFKGCPTVAP